MIARILPLIWLMQGCALADDTIATDRPAVTDSSVVVPAGTLVSENGFTYTSNQRSTSTPLNRSCVSASLLKLNCGSQFPITSARSPALPVLGIFSSA